MFASNCNSGSIRWPNGTGLVEFLADLHNSYGSIHAYLAIVICFFGTLTNFLMIIVLTRPQMLTPINVILCAIAVCDVEVMVSYVVFVCHFLIQATFRCEPGDFSLGWSKFMLFHAHGSVVFHSTSIWLTVALAQFRVLSLRHATANADWITPRRTAGVVLVSLGVVLIINCPNFLTFELKEIPAIYVLPCLTEKRDFIQWVNQSFVNADLHSEDFLFNASLHYYPPCSTVSSIMTNCLLMKITFWSLGLLFKVFPCFLLTVFICILLHILTDVKKRRKRLGNVLRGKRLPTDHTTPMLIGVLTIFLITELPQGVLLVMTGIFTADFNKEVYQHLGDVMDLLSLINSATNFVMYCTMSQKFRAVFCSSFLPVRYYNSLPARMRQRKESESHTIGPHIVKYPRPSLFKGMFLSIENGLASRSPSRSPSYELMKPKFSLSKTTVPPRSSIEMTTNVGKNVNDVFL